MVSKRPRAESPPPSTAKATRISNPARKIVCQLPPTCHVRPTFLEHTSQLESHYATCHAHVCGEARCRAIFPERRLLDLHHTECHDPIAAIRQEKGERIYACFDGNCTSMFMTPKGRRLHLIDKHKYPPNYYFSVTNHGIGRLLLKWGEGASLLRNQWKPRKLDTDNGPEKDGVISEREDNVQDDKSGGSEKSGYCIPKALIAPSPTATVRIGTPPQIFDTERPLDGFASNRTLRPRAQKPDPVDTLTDSMSSLSLIPPAIQFGRGGSKGGFQVASSGRGSGRGGSFHSRGQRQRRGRGTS